MRGELETPASMEQIASVLQDAELLASQGWRD
jgi:hypothetical protein